MKKKLPDCDASFVDLFRLPHEAVKWELLKTAIELRVFDQLEEPATAKTLAARLSSHPQNTEHLLNALTGLGCLSKKNGQFRNTRLAQTFLAGGGERSIGDTMLFMDQWSRPVFNGGMKDLVIRGPARVEDIGHEDIWEAGARAVLNLTRCGRARMISELVASLPEFESFSRILDLGSGPGLIGLAVASSHSSLICDLFDQPAVCRVAEEVIAEYGMEDRVRTISGNYMEDPIHGPYDLIMANFTLNFYKDRLNEIMAKVHEALIHGGVFLVTSDGLTNEKTKPAASVIGWLSNMLQGRDMAFERGTIARAMLDAGFVSTQSETIDRPEMEAHGPVDIILARKGLYARP